MAFPFTEIILPHPQETLPVPRYILEIVCLVANIAHCPQTLQLWIFGVSSGISYATISNSQLVACRRVFCDTQGNPNQSLSIPLRPSLSFRCLSIMLLSFSVGSQSWRKYSLSKSDWHHLRPSQILEIQLLPQRNFSQLLSINLRMFIVKFFTFRPLVAKSLVGSCDKIRNAFLDASTTSRTVSSCLVSTASTCCQDLMIEDQSIPLLVR